ncbi:porin family protein [Chryseobacterium sp. ISL-6]|uniref:porin family protein n=1 Tax=Chryseobacterium sp. ISL-6 TaxID=2819143 RepID=UPI001BE8FCD4|nr:porin family protein [Chryseobacterium sp. ISL-6]MBT2619482.1 PorT family protein [Chryseobacterium sp. ISL-6]
MKKILIILIIILGQQFSYAQTIFENNSSSEIDTFELNTNRISWGVKAGLNYYNFYGKERDFIFADSDTKFKPGIYVGIFVNTKINRNIGLTHELIFNQRRVGVIYKDTDDHLYKSAINSSYIDIVPANINYQLSKFRLYAGPYVSVLVAANTKRKDQNGDLFRDKSIFGDAANDESKSYYLQKFDFGINLGVDYQLKDRWSVGFRYNHGFTDLFQNANSFANGNSKKDKIKIYNRGFMLSLAYDLASHHSSAE